MEKTNRGFRSHLFRSVFTTSIVLWQLFTPPTSQAQISPGDLAAPHAFLEGITNCVECHELGGGPSAEKCLACHLEIKTRLQAKRGLHHKVFTINRTACFSCHSDHAGKKFRMVHWPNGEQNFDHTETGFGLNGKHKTLDCRDCHKSAFVKENLKKLQPKIDLNRTFLGLRKDCLSCHFDEHRGQLSRDCLTCHNERAWKPAAKFDHKRAKFRLTGKHITVDCAKCHPQARDSKARLPAKTFFAKFVGLRFNSCKACHNDVHKGKFGANCQRCHSTDGWRGFNSTTFDHSKTRFPLLGKHRAADCVQCHKSGDFLKPLRFGTCAACHKDVHKGKFGKDCRRCHSENGWKNFDRKKFDHSKTDFALRGMHKTVDCIKCHKTGKMLVPLKSEQCRDCHKDSHRGQFAKRPGGGRCENCHNEHGFIPALYGVGEHAKSGFPLTGSHLATACRMCHTMAKTKSGTRVRRFVFSTVRCETCHRDIHFGQFSKIKPVKVCEVCHAPVEWAELQFDHNKNSRFALEGAHKEVNCSECHKWVRLNKDIFRLYKPIEPACETCHSGGKMKLRNGF